MAGRTGRSRRRRAAAAAAVLALGGFALFLAGCQIGGDGDVTPSPQGPTFTIISGSENESLEPILVEYGRRHGFAVEMEYLGSVDIMRLLQSGDPPCDGVWPASSLWISLGDERRVVRDARSIMTSPVVFGIRKPLAEELGFVGREDVRVADLLDAIGAGNLSFTMTSATQSNSGASAYLGFVNAFSGSDEVITAADLADPRLREDMTELLAGIDRSSGSSGWLKDLFLESDYDAMVNYESLIIEANQELVRRGEDPLWAVYPADGLAVADSPLGFIDKGNAKKAAFFTGLQEYLLSDAVQDELLAKGRRTGLAGVLPATDPEVFNPDWGIDTERVISPIRLPEAAVIREALVLYQTTLRKPSATVYCLDFSGSMEGAGQRQVKQAMKLLLDPSEAARYLLQPGPDDVTVVIAFDDELMARWQVTGNDPAELSRLLGDIRALRVRNKTAVFSAAAAGVEALAAVDGGAYLRAVILMTDGESNAGLGFGGFADVWEGAGQDIPVFSIMFGAASAEQLDPLAELTHARVFDGRADLVQTFLQVKGYNN